MLFSHPTFVLTILFTLLLALCGFKIYSLSRANKLLAGQLTETTRSLEQVKRELAKSENPKHKFRTLTAAPGEAELTTEFQKPRLKNHAGHNASAPPERYSYIHTLMEKGMTDEDIASLLSISLHETRQLVNLSKLARPS